MSLHKGGVRDCFRLDPRGHHLAKRSLRSDDVTHAGACIDQRIVSCSVRLNSRGAHLVEDLFDRWQVAVWSGGGRCASRAWITRLRNLCDRMPSYEAQSWCEAPETLVQALAWAVHLSRRGKADASSRCASSPSRSRPPARALRRSSRDLWLDGQPPSAYCTASWHAPALRWGRCN